MSIAQSLDEGQAQVEQLVERFRRNLEVQEAGGDDPGKAAGGAGLHQRIRQLINFGWGSKVGHRGGRLLWHLADHAELQICWRECDCAQADAVESAMIEAFRRVHGTRPFANMVK